MSGSSSKTALPTNILQLYGVGDEERNVTAYISRVTACQPDTCFELSGCVFLTYYLAAHGSLKRSPEVQAGVYQSTDMLASFCHHWSTFGCSCESIQRSSWWALAEIHSQCCHNLATFSGDVATMMGNYMISQCCQYANIWKSCYATCCYNLSNIVITL